VYFASPRPPGRISFPFPLVSALESSPRYSTFFLSRPPPPPPFPSLFSRFLVSCVRPLLPRPRQMSPPESRRGFPVLCGASVRAEFTLFPPPFVRLSILFSGPYFFLHLGLLHRLHRQLKCSSAGFSPQSYTFLSHGEPSLTWALWREVASRLLRCVSSVFVDLLTFFLL